MNTKTKRSLFALGLVSLAGIVAWALLRAPAVSVVAVERQALVQSVLATCRVQAPAKIRIGATLLARVAEVKVEEGARVARGQLLARLEDEELHAALEQAKASAQATRLRLAQFAAVTAPAAREQLRQAQAELDQAQQRFERVHDLAQQGASPPADLETARTALELARSRNQTALLAAKSAAPEGFEGRLSLVQLEERQAQVALQIARLQQTFLEAPADGVVLERRVEPGDVARPGEPLLVLGRAGPVGLLCAIDERNAALVARDQPATASAEAYPTERFQARVALIAPAVDEQRGTIDVKLLVETPPAFLLPDMTVSVEIEAGRKGDALVVPSAAVVDPASPAVLVVQGERLIRRPIAIGMRGEGVLEVRGGLQEGELVVRDPQTGQLKPGQRVRPVPGGA